MSKETKIFIGGMALLLPPLAFIGFVLYAGFQFVWFGIGTDAERVFASAFMAILTGAIFCIYLVACGDEL